jgi:dihydroxy-acid dehydratase
VTETTNYIVMSTFVGLNRPGIMVYGGTIRAGTQPSNGDTLDIVSAFQSYGQFVYDKISEEERKEIIQHSCPGPGACGGMYTANTMATAIEALGECNDVDFICNYHWSVIS